MTEEKVVKKNKGKKIALILGIVITVLAIVGLSPFVIPIKQVTDTLEVELGETISEELTNYVSGFQPAFWVTDLDLSLVDTNNVGDYTATVKHGFQEFTYSVFVRDTTPPKLTLKTETFYLEKGKTYSASYFVEEVFDLGGDVLITITESRLPDVKRSYAYSDLCGTSVLTFYAVDNSGNKSDYTLDVFFDTPPEIVGTKNFYVVPGTTLNYLENVEATDEIDGIVTNNLRVNAEDVDLSSKGKYDLIYLCEDSYGLSSEVKVSVNVLDAIEIQELINTHKIHRLTEKIEGAYNLYDIGVYDGKTMEEMYEIIHPTAVRIAPSEKSYGSGFILKITEEDVIIGTCQHVVKSNEKVQVYFFDGTTVTGEVAGTVYDYDLGFVSVKLEDVPKELLDKLYTVHIDKGYWDKLENEADLEIGVRCINDQGKVWRDRKGKLIYKQGVTDLMWRELPQVTRVSTQLFHGASGSGLFDIHGNFMGVATYIITGAGRYESYCSTVETFCQAYEKIYEEKAYY